MAPDTLPFPPSEHAADLQRQVRHHNKLYWDDAKPEIPDEEYDALVRELKTLWPDAPVLREMGPQKKAPPAPVQATELERLGTEVVHGSPMLSLDKAYTDEELARWTDKIQGDLIAMPKIDGVACRILYGPDGALKLAATRGDGERGDDITANVRAGGFVPTHIRASAVEVRGELYMKRSRFKEQFAAQFANPRNLTAGAIKQKDPGKVKAYGLSFLAYDLPGAPLELESQKLAQLRTLGFETIPVEVVQASDAPGAFVTLAAQRQGWDFEADGVVFRANRVSEQSRLGVTAHHPRWALAYKFMGETAPAKLLQIIWSVSRNGTLTPVAEIEPTPLSGVTVSRASLHHAGYLEKLGLRQGATLLVMRRGDVIPHVEGVVTPGGKPFPIPETCPSCGSPTRQDGDFLACTRPTQCPDAVVGMLKHFTQNLDIQGLGPKVLRTLFEKGLVKTPPDFYRLTPEALKGLERMGETLAQKLVANIQAKRVLSLEEFLVALGIDELGPNIAGVLKNHCRTLERVRAVTAEELASIHGVGEQTARVVTEGLKAKAPLLDDLLQVVRIQTQEAKVQSDHRLSGKGVVFTGSLTRMDRKEAQKRVLALGGLTPSSVTKELDYLVVGQEKEGAESSKMKLAKRLIAAGSELKVLSEDQFLQLLEGTVP